MPLTTTPARLLLALAASLLALVAAAPARAGVLVSTTKACDALPVEQPFSRWLDPARYVLVPGGDFESGAAGWSGSRAQVVPENEPWRVHGRSDASSLELSPGGSATSTSLCVGLFDPTLRFFARSSGTLVASLASALLIEVLFEDAGGTVRALPIGAVKAPIGWSPTLPRPVVANLLPLLPGERTAIAFRFTAVGAAGWRIDDVYVDPKSRR